MLPVLRIGKTHQPQLYTPFPSYSGRESVKRYPDPAPQGFCFAPSLGETFRRKHKVKGLFLSFLPGLAKFHKIPQKLNKVQGVLRQLPPSAEGGGKFREPLCLAHRKNLGRVGKMDILEIALQTEGDPEAK